MITAVLSLALGIGATTAIFSVIYSVLLDPYPYKDADRMVHVQMRGKNQTDFRGLLPFVNGTGYLELKQMFTVDDVFLQQEDQENLTGDQIPVTANVGRFSPNVFDYIGVTPVIGREFIPGDAPTAFPPPSLSSVIYSGHAHSRSSRLLDVLCEAEARCKISHRRIPIPNAD